LIKANSYTFSSTCQMSEPQRNQVDTNLLLAFEDRYTGPDASRLSATAEISERYIHDSLVYEHYGHWEPSTQKTFDGFCRRWVDFCNKRQYSRFDTSAIKGEAFLQAERQRHQNPGENVKIALTQFVKLCKIRGCPEFSKSEMSFMHAVVNRARDDSAEYNRSKPVDEEKKMHDRSSITSQDLEQLLSVCAEQDDRLKGARTKALILVNIQTGKCKS